MASARDAAEQLRDRTILAVFAHPDDESIACGGTLARLVDLGARVALVCASHGERGSPDGPLCDDELGRTRGIELRRAAHVLGVSSLTILDYPDGDLRWTRATELSADIAMAIRRHAPAAVITFGHDGLYWHPDHIAVYERTTMVVRSFGRDAPPLYYVTMPRGIMRAIGELAKAQGWTPPSHGFWSLEPDAFGLHASAPDLIVDVREWADRKLAAVRCHRTQTGPTDPFDRMSDAEAEQWLGEEHFHRAAIDGVRGSILELLGEPVSSS